MIRALTPLRLILATMAVLSGSVLLSALTTQDPSWWTVAFSNLGVFDDASSALFNAGLIAAGATTCLFAIRLQLDLRRLHSARRAAVLVPAQSALAGLSIAMVGLFPETPHPVVHDIAALALAGSVAGVVLTGQWLLRSRSPQVCVSTVVGAVIIAAATPLLVTEAITLASYELVLFGLFFLWLSVASREVHRALRASGSVVGDGEHVDVVRRAIWTRQ